MKKLKAPFSEAASRVRNLTKLGINEGLFSILTGSTDETTIRLLLRLPPLCTRQHFFQRDVEKS
ncbi:hypothetical protein [Leisingera sp.]|uniref:hypothetical protein n=1 Tax=Leisingera sp. TaxID=1879318 RepID=UPI002B27B8C8|nr:hypothetical protein [Leisingera sp.]